MGDQTDQGNTLFGIDIFRLIECRLFDQSPFFSLRKRTAFCDCMQMSVAF